MISFKWMQFSSINFLHSDFSHGAKKIKFHNHISKKQIEKINDYSKEIIKSLKLLNDIKFNNLENYINKIKNADVIDSNQNIEITIEIMKRYGFAERFILKKMLGGENRKAIEYFSKKQNSQNLITANLMNKQSRKLFKIPIIVNKKVNKVRLIILTIKNKEKTLFYPLFIDIHHFAYSSTNYDKLPKNMDLFEEKFRNKIFSLF